MTVHLCVGVGLWCPGGKNCVIGRTFFGEIFWHFFAAFLQSFALNSMKNSLLIAQDALAEAEAEVDELLKDLERTSLELLQARQELHERSSLTHTSTLLASAALATRDLPQSLAAYSSPQTSSPPWVFTLSSTALGGCLSLYLSTLASSTAHPWWSKPFFPAGPSFHAIAQLCHQTLPAQTLPVLLLGLLLWAGRRHTFLALLPLTLFSLLGALAAHTYVLSSSSSAPPPPSSYWTLLLSPTVLASTVVGAFLTTSHATGLGVRARTEDWSILSRLSAPTAVLAASPPSTLFSSAYSLLKAGVFLLLSCLRVAALAGSLVLSAPVLLLPLSPPIPTFPPIGWAALALWWVGCGIVDLGMALLTCRSLRAVKARFLLLLERTSAAGPASTPPPTSTHTGRPTSPPLLPHRLPHIMAHLGEQERAASHSALGAAACLWVSAGACFVLSSTPSLGGWVRGQGGLPPHQLFLAAFAPHLAVLLGRRG